ncbi:MAG: DUF262 domain-containing protein [Chloroflexota bacterium]|nr:DUF262 domain-containing protein [Chloroflexota bacterium]
MKAGILNLRNLFLKDVRYVIPTFQRPYVWTKDDQWDPLWEDVQTVAERYLEELAEAGEGGAAIAEQEAGSHFLGAVVVQQRPSPASQPELRHVIDGQQRLTTLQLLLDAAQEVLEAHGHDEGRRLTRYVLNHEDLTGGDDALLFKVWPSSSDQAAFRRAMENGSPTEGFEHSAIVQAHEFFHDQVEQWLAAGDDGGSLRAHALEAALGSLLELVVIDLDLDDDPNVIFETLNARGTPLLASDLIKNLVLHTAESEGINPEQLNADYWSEFDDRWWREEVRQGRIVRPRIDTYLNYWLEARIQDEVKTDEVFSKFRRYLEDASSVGGVAVDIRETADVYSRLQRSEDDDPLSEFLYRWRTLDIRVLTPVLIWLLGQPDVRDDVIRQSLDTIESYLVRRMLCRIPTQGYNRFFLELLSRLASASTGEAHDVIRDFLAQQDTETRLWPDDDRVRAAIEELPLYSLLTRGRLRFVLEALEDSMRSPKTEYPNAPRGSLTIEHLMPQGWHEEDWPLEVPDGPVEAIARRNHLLHTMGNLTLVTASLNSQPLSNAPWETKRTGLAAHSRLQLNMELTQVESWSEASILERSRQLADRVVTIWPRS